MSSSWSKGVIPKIKSSMIASDSIWNSIKSKSSWRNKDSSMLLEKSLPYNLENRKWLGSCLSKGSTWLMGKTLTGEISRFKYGWLMELDESPLGTTCERKINSSLTNWSSYWVIGSSPTCETSKGEGHGTKIIYGSSSRC